MKSIVYSILPLTFIAFSKKYTADKDEYKKYLIQNKQNHHYNHMSLDEWFKQQTNIPTNIPIQTT